MIYFTWFFWVLAEKKWRRKKWADNINSREIGDSDNVTYRGDFPCLQGSSWGIRLISLSIFPFNLICLISATHYSVLTSICGQFLRFHLEVRLIIAYPFGSGLFYLRLHMSLGMIHAAISDRMLLFSWLSSSLLCI